MFASSFHCPSSFWGETCCCLNHYFSVIHCLSLAVAAYKSFSLSFVFRSLIMMYLGVNPLKCILFRFHSIFWIWKHMSFTKFEPLFFQMFFCSISRFFLGNFDNVNVRPAVTIPQVLGIYSFFKKSLFFLVFIFIISIVLSLSSLILLAPRFTIEPLF